MQFLEKLYPASLLSRTFSANAPVSLLINKNVRRFKSDKAASSFTTNECLTYKRLSDGEQAIERMII